MIFRKFSILIVVVILIASSAGSAIAGDDHLTLGEMLKDAKAVSLAELLAGPDKYVGQPIRVEGRIGDVCPKAGCWIDIVDEGEQKIRFKVQDGVIVFPTEVKGKNVVAEGIFAKVEMSEDEAVSWAKHLAEERGEEFDPETAEIVRVYYRIDGKGAVIR